jgi:hypothetical protein
VIQPPSIGGPGIGDLDAHYRRVLRALADGRLIPFLGAGVNLVGRPPGEEWSQARYLPTGHELAEALASNARYPTEDVRDLSRVAQYVDAVLGQRPLYEELRAIFDADFPPSVVHRFFAQASVGLGASGGQIPSLLIATTNYDDALERAFREVGRPFDVVSYVGAGQHQGRFWHAPAYGGEPLLIERPQLYRDVNPAERPVILKLLGSVDRGTAERDSYVITEDDYADYLAHADITASMPVTLAARLKRSSYLFLGYSLRDWNLRVVLDRVRGREERDYVSWAVMRDPSRIETAFWHQRYVETLAYPLDGYMEGLLAAVGDLQPESRS